MSKGNRNLEIAVFNKDRNFITSILNQKHE